jgi:hypothetical protein
MAQAPRFLDPQFEAAQEAIRADHFRWNIDDEAELERQRFDNGRQVIAGHVQPDPAAD